MSVRVGLIGCGGVAGAHVKSLNEIEQAQVVACTDLDEERAAKAAAQFPGASAYAEVAKMLDAEELDSAYVCVPPNAHGEIELALAERGIPFFVEKPIGIDRRTPERILERVEAGGLLTCVGYMNRYRATVARVRDMLAQDPPVLARGGWIGGMPGVHWWRRKQMSGGQIIEQTTHTCDLARYLFGEVESVFCVGRQGVITDVEGYDIEDASICTLVFASGMLCELSSSCAAGVGGLVGLEIWCRNTHLKLETWNLDLTVQKSGEQCRIESREDIFVVEDTIWIDAVQRGDGSEIKSSYADACKSQFVTVAANESIISGKPEKP